MPEQAFCVLVDLKYLICLYHHKLLKDISDLMDFHNAELLLLAL